MKILNLTKESKEELLRTLAERSTESFQKQQDAVDAIVRDVKANGDAAVFAYTQNDALETKFKLYEIEEIMDPRAFFRANKAVIVNLAKIQSLSPAFGGRFEAVLENGYKVIVSRNYVPKLKELLGL